MCTTAGTLEYHVRIYIKLQLMNFIRRSDPPRHQSKKFDFVMLYFIIPSSSVLDVINFLAI